MIILTIVFEMASISFSVSLRLKRATLKISFHLPQLYSLYITMIEYDAKIGTKRP